MSIRNEDIYHLIDQLDNDDRKIVFDLLQRLIHRPIKMTDEDGEQFIVEADNSPLTKEEIKALEQADREIDNGEVVDWEEAKRELGYIQIGVG
jgi:hypothetical protein